MMNSPGTTGVMIRFFEGKQAASARQNYSYMLYFKHLE